MLVFSLQAQASIYCLAHDTSQYLQGTLNLRAQTLMAEGEKLLKMRTVHLVRLLNASTEWQLRGQLNHGVFEIMNDAGQPVVLKIVEGEEFLVRNPMTGLLMDFRGNPAGSRLQVSASAFKEYMDVHSILGEMFVAPRLLAIVNSNSLKDAFRTKWSVLKEAAEKFEFDGRWIDRPRYGGSQAVGVVMQKLPLEPEQDPIHPISRPTAPPGFMARWKPTDLTRSIRDIIEIRRRVLVAGVRVQDQQFVVTPSAQAYLIDLDQARFDPHVDFMDVSYEILKLVDQWQTATGERLDPGVKFQLLDEAALPHAVCTSDEDFKPLLSNWRCDQRLTANK